jgi:hypothetical protein
MLAYNPRYIGGDINGSVINMTHSYTNQVLEFSQVLHQSQEVGARDMWRYHAAKRALEDVFKIKGKIELSPGCMIIQTQ